MILPTAPRYLAPIRRGVLLGAGRSAVLMGLLAPSVVVSGYLLLHIFLVVSLVAYFVLSNWSRDEWGNKLMSDMESLCFRLPLQYHLY